MKILVTIFCLLCTAIQAGPAHKDVTYIIVPFAEVTKEMRGMVAPLDSLRHTVTLPDLVVLKVIRYIDKGDPEPTPDPNDEPMTKEQLEKNAKLETYRWAHKTTPLILKKYKQFSYAQIKEEMKKPEWNPKEITHTEITTEPK